MIKTQLLTRLKGMEKANKTEARYANEVLEPRRFKKEIIDWSFETIKLKVGTKTCWYCPDFTVIRSDMVIEFHETKGFWRDDALVKIKSAALQYPGFVFRSFQHIKGEWVEKLFSEGPAS